METIEAQLDSIVAAVGSGMLVGFLFDLRRAARAVVKVPRLASDVGDVLFWVLAAAVVYALLLLVNWGEVRSHVLLGFAVGFVMYRRTLGWVVLKAGWRIGESAEHVAGALRLRLFRVLTLTQFFIWTAIVAGCVTGIVRISIHGSRAAWSEVMRTLL